MIVPSLHAATAVVLAGLLACDPQPAPDIQVNYTEKKPVFFNSHSTAQLRAIAPSMGTVNLADFPVTTGVTRGKITMETSILFRSLGNLLGRYCLWQAEVTINVTYRPEVYIAKEYRPGTCRYTQTKLHELRHVEIDKGVMKDLLPELKKVVAARAAKIGVRGPFDDTQREAAKSVLLHSMQDAVSAELDRIESVRAMRQQMVDTPAEYTRLSLSCPGEPIR
ncbi:MAG: hypothetical protein EPN97_18660 [Alphaproteobacteria bacterium]|nr:MAG: hypothetical protein EPN97_18660 [Alphaproteobacteria bacterium]